MDNETRQVIRETANEMVIQLKKAGMMRDDELSAMRKTEDLLKRYKELKTIPPEPGSASDIVLSRVDRALDALQDDEYCGLIEMIYFDGATREECAEFYDVDPITITRNKKRMIGRIRDVVFTDEVIKELFV